MRSPRKLWAKAISKVSHKHNRSTSDTTYEQNSYSLECVEDSRKMSESREVKGSESSEGSFSSAVMSPRESGQPVESVESGPGDTESETVESAFELPAYTIDSPDWEQPGVLDDDENVQDKITSVLEVLSKVYSVAKMIEVSFVGFDIDTDNVPTGLSYHIDRAESVIKSNSLPQLKETVENLYYSVYARLVVEMANAELCSSFTADARRMSASDYHALPEPGQMYKIFLICKEVLDSPSVRSHLNANTIRVCQEGFFQRMASRLADAGFTYDNYGEFVVSEVSNDQSAFCRKWLALAAVYRMPSAQILALLSEKYLAIIPKASVADEIPIADLPFVNPNTIDFDIWERQIILDHRQATLAKLEGKTIGDIRREESDRPVRLTKFVEERKCVCPSACTCAFDCTMDVERLCPCAPRMLRILLVQRGKGPAAGLSFASKCAGLAKAVFDGLSVINREVSDTDLLVALVDALQLIVDEISKERASCFSPVGV